MNITETSFIATMGGKKIRRPKTAYANLRRGRPRRKSLPIPLMLVRGGVAVVACLVLLSQIIGGW